MEWLNYHHLFYFSVIAREGGISPAARKLNLTHSTLSAQLKALEEHLGSPLFERRGRRLVLTPFGAEAASYAEDIFRLGRELSDAARGHSSPGREVLRIGVVSSLPKTLVHHLLTPALDHFSWGAVQVRQEVSTVLVEALVAGRLHAAVTDEIPAGNPGVKVHAHPLGETDILLYARAPLARALRKNFPASLARAPFVLPPASVALRRRIDSWLSERGLTVTVKAEIEDAGLLRAFGSGGRGVFPVRAAVRAEVEDLHDVELVGPCTGVTERYYLASTERRIRHRAVVALAERSKLELNWTASGRRS